MASLTITEHPKSKLITRNPNPSQLHQALKLVILKGCDGKLVCGVKRCRDEQTSTDHRSNGSKKLRVFKGSKQVESVTNQVGNTPSKSSKSSSAVSVGVKSSAKSEIGCARKAMTSNKSKTEHKKMESSIGMQVPLPTARTTCDLKEASPVCETLKLSPDHKALRAEMLKKRFADTLLKAQNQTLFVCAAERHDRLKVEWEKKRLERQEAEAKALTDRKIQRQREREAARMALEKMEESVEIEDNLSILTDLAYMIGDFSFAGPLGGCGSMYVNRKLWRPLERFGLYLKEDYEDLVF